MKDRQSGLLAIPLMTSLLLLIAPPSRAQGSARIDLATNPAPPAAAKSSSIQADPHKELKGIERRFFFHEYDHDPLEKRLERIELLVFGGVQDGDNLGRLAKLKAALLTRDREAAQRLTEKNKTLNSPSAQSPSKTTAPASGAQYPILQTLEWKALKKTYGGETLDQRLERLETTLLGQPSTAMAYSDRIDRLCKIIGIDSTYAAPPTARATPTPRGPLPKAGRRSVSPFFNNIPHSLDDDDSGFSFEDDFKERATIDLREMMQMMQQMQQMMPPGYAVPRGVRPIPDGGGGNPFVVPSEPAKKPRIPPYADPNSI